MSENIANKAVIFMTEAMKNLKAEFPAGRKTLAEIRVQKERSSRETPSRYF